MKKSEISFDNGNRATVVLARQDANGDAILSALNLDQPRAVIMVFGGADALDQEKKAQLENFFDDAIAPLAAETGAIITDGGTQAGIMTMMGEAVARCDYKCPLLGIAPAGKVAYPETKSIADRTPLEPNHSHFVLVESNEWGGETGAMFALARAFAAPVVALLFNGGAIAADEALQTVRNRWPLLVIEGSGRFADEVSAAVRDDQIAKSAEVSEIAGSGRVALFHVNDAASTLKTQLRRMFSQE